VSVVCWLILGMPGTRFSKGRRGLSGAYDWSYLQTVYSLPAELPVRQTGRFYCPADYNSVY
jgi:hypothetical protein